MRGRARWSAGAVVGLVLAGLGPPALAEATAPVPAPALAEASATAEAAPGRSAARYVAMGDSYSSGLGTFVYDPQTTTADNQCRRSPLAYGPLLSYADPRLRPLRFVACSGATTSDFLTANSDQAGEPAQLAALRRTTRTVSLTVGGNDLGFAGVAGACVQSSQTTGFGCSRSPALNAVVAARLAALAGAGQAPAPDGSAIVAIARLLADIGERAPRAEIFLAGYPELFGDDRADYRADPTAPSQASCLVNPLVNARVDYADAQWFNQATQQLNGVLRAAVERAEDAGVEATYVSAGTFDGHGLCDQGTAWIQPVLLGSGGQPLPESLHPTAQGQVSGYARAFRRAGI
ncbi:MAG: SGNH/GDSL hydrolase family protein [Actinomycetes bacterium]